MNSIADIGDQEMPVMAMETTATSTMTAATIRAARASGRPPMKLAT